MHVLTINLQRFTLAGVNVSTTDAQASLLAPMMGSVVPAVSEQHGAVRART